jgi:hypothetical protein
MGRDIEVRAVARYRRVRYPTRQEAERMGVELYRVPDSVLARYGKGAVAGATFLLLGTNSACFGAMVAPPGSKEPEASQYLNEAVVRDMVAQRFAGEEIYFQEDQVYSIEGVKFVADGFNDELGIGYDYVSYEDLKEMCEKSEDEGWDDEFMDSEEKAVIEAKMEEGGDAILVFEAGASMSDMEEKTRVSTQLEEFIVWLKEQGRI